MKVYAEVIPASLGRAMHRINKNLKRYAPDDILFVDKPEDADIQILDSLEESSLKNVRNKNYVLLQHCIHTASPPEKPWSYFFHEAKMVVSYLDLPGLIKYDDFNFYRTPYGADSSLFYNQRLQRNIDGVTTGYVAITECINEVHDAIKRYNGKMVHIGGNLNLSNAKHVENISDEQLNHYYNTTRYVFSLRRVEGFEFPIIEGTLCGARGVCINDPCYTYWYHDLVEYVDDTDFQTMSDQLYNILAKPYRSVTPEEIDYVRVNFNWNTIMINLWKRIKEL